jgi:hypothetical protein
MREHFLFFLWQYQLYEKGDLRTTDGRSLTIVHPGYLNNDAGPDFLNGNIIIDGVRWYGHIEIHVNGEDWKIHGHHNDPAYQNVVLHVVYDQRSDTPDHNGHPLPTLVLKHRIPLHLYRKQEILFASRSWIPCSGHIHSVRKITVSMTLHREAINRLSSKAALWLERLSELKGDWSQLAYEVFLRAMGFKVNSEAFELLARYTPFKVVGPNRHDPFRVEALLLGQAQLLKKDDPYTSRLKKEYTFLKAKYQLQPLNPGVCRFLRTRPANFPDRRLTQAVGILTSSPDALGIIMGELDKGRLEKVLTASASDYWKVLCSDPSSSSSLGKSSLDSLYVNMVAPLHFAMALKRMDEEYKEQVANFLSAVRPESNSVIRKWSAEGLKARSALESQGLLQHYRNNCQKKKCLECPIGMEIMKQTDSAPSIHSDGGSHGPP